MVGANSRIDRQGESFSAQFSETLSEILKAVDGFMTQVGKTDSHRIITDYRVEELEKRIKIIEASA